jgi:hemoglobin/transferrin/lactoferrin receptor protein
MKRSYFFFIVAVFAAAVNGFAQTITVRDEITREPVSNAVITAHLPAPNIRIWAATTNEKGQADITQIAGEDSVYITHPNYGRQGFTMAEVKTAEFDVSLHARTLLMNEVVFSANKSPEPVAEVPYTIAVVPAKEVAFSNPQTSADMLMNTGKVFVHAASKPTAC